MTTNTACADSVCAVTARWALGAARKSSRRPTSSLRALSRWVCVLLSVRSSRQEVLMVVMIDVLALKTLDKRLVCGKARARAAERTGHSLRMTDASRRGPGTYERQTHAAASPPTSPGRRSNYEGALDAELCSSMANAGFTDAEVLGRAALEALKTARKAPTNNQELQPASSEPGTHASPPKRSFGRVQSRDLLVSMTAAGHLNPETLGPGVYETPSDWSSRSPSHNINYTSEFLKKQRRQCPQRSRQQQNGGAELGSKELEADTSSMDDNDKGRTTRELWRAMRSGPSLPTPTARLGSTT